MNNFLNFIHFHKDTIEVVAANGAAVWISVKEVNDLLTTVSISLAIIFTIYKIIKEVKNK